MTATSLQTNEVLPVVAALVRRMLGQRRRLIFGFTLGAAALAAMTSALYSSFGDSYADLVDELPAAFDSMIGGADFSTAEGFLQVELFSIVAPGLVLAVAIMVGARSLAGAEEDGTLPLITTGPVRRSSVASAAILSTIMAAGFVSAGVFVGVVVGGRAGGVDVSLGRLAAACVSVWLFGAATGAISLAAGAFTGSRAAATMVGTVVGVGSYVIDSFFPLTSVLEPFAKFSLWYPYAANQPLANGLAVDHALILVAVAVVGSAVTLWGFERRDLRS